MAPPASRAAQQSPVPKVGHLPVGKHVVRTQWEERVFGGPCRAGKWGNRWVPSSGSESRQDIPSLQRQRSLPVHSPHPPVSAGPSPWIETRGAATQGRRDQLLQDPRLTLLPGRVLLSCPALSGSWHPASVTRGRTGTGRAAVGARDPPLPNALSLRARPPSSLLLLLLLLLLLPSSGQSTKTPACKVLRGLAALSRRHRRFSVGVGAPSPPSFGRPGIHSTRRGCSAELHMAQPWSRFREPDGLDHTAAQSKCTARFLPLGGYAFSTVPRNVLEWDCGAQLTTSLCCLHLLHDHLETRPDSSLLRFDHRGPPSRPQVWVRGRRECSGGGDMGPFSM
ncbi:heparan sulfate glucosamine 3-O-sulfotransferase 1 isoform X1 [Marmota monax]|uniref:heparan sulfate glucosamine 3-O-sulfotransferase 1 isoform X1 n=1 Tax=Marmota monax TaxID=9995 RepID=UPI0026ED7193|nr:heparan sulfate glucosamine 3-O-sulfotransferase 1 isoform X1 [Marmota monax]